MFRDRNNNLKQRIKLVNNPNIVEIKVKRQEPCLNDKAAGKTKLQKKSKKKQNEKSKKQAAKAQKQGKNDGCGQIPDEV
jgi:hypothetical protein